MQKFQNEAADSSARGDKEEIANGTRKGDRPRESLGRLRLSSWWAGSRWGAGRSWLTGRGIHTSLPSRSGPQPGPNSKRHSKQARAGRRRPPAASRRRPRRPCPADPPTRADHPSKLTSVGVAVACCPSSAIAQNPRLRWALQNSIKSPQKGNPH